MLFRMRYQFSLLAILLSFIVIVGCNGNNIESNADNNNDNIINESDPDVGETTNNDSYVNDDDDVIVYEVEIKNRNEDLAIFEDNVMAAPTIRELIDVFSKLEIFYPDVEGEDYGRLATYEWIGEEELNGELTDKFYIHLTFNREPEPYEQFAEIWINKDGKILQLIDENEKTLVSGVDELTHYTAYNYFGHVLQSFTYFDLNVRGFLNYESTRIEEYSTSNDTLFGENVEVHFVKIFNDEERELYATKDNHKEAMITYYNGFEVTMYYLDYKGEDAKEYETYFKPEFLDYQFK